MPLVKNFELTTEDYEFGFSVDGENALGVSVIEQLPSVNVGSALKEFLLANPRMRSFFRSEIEYYNRQDHGQRTLPALNIYTATGDHNGPYGWLEGKLEIKIILPLSLKRDIVADVAPRIANYLFLVMNDYGSIEFVGQHVPGLVQLGYNPTFKYDKAYILNDKKVDAYIVEGVANYKISMLEYYESLWVGETYEKSNIRVNLAEVTL